MRKTLLLSLALAAGAWLVAASSAKAIAECEFAGQPTPEQLAACQAASAAAPSAPAGAGDQGAAAAARGAEMEARGKEMERQGLQKQLEGLKKGILGLEKGFLKIVAQYDSLEKGGMKLPDEIKAKIARGKEIIAKAKAATTAEEIQESGSDELETIMEELGDSIGDLKQQAGILKGMKKAVKSVRNGLSMFDKLIAKLEKQNIEPPADITENLKDVKAIISGIEAGKSWDELSALGLENIEEFFDKLDDGRERLIMLARWPQTLKQINNQLAAMDKQAVKLAATAAKLSGSEVDVSTFVAKFKDGLAELKQIRDRATEKIKIGDGIEALAELEDNFFGKIDQVYENVRVVETMAGLNKFAAEYKKSLTTAQKQIAALAKKKIKTAEVQQMLNRYKAKGDGILAMIKIQPLDDEALTAALDEFESLRTELMAKAKELAGGAVMPWEQGRSDLKELSLPKELDQFAAKNAEMDLKDLKEQKFGEEEKPKTIGQGILIEAENETKSYTAPLNSRPATNLKEINPSWRPAYSGTGDWYLAAKGEWLEYNFTVPAGGLYQFWIRDYVDKYQPKGVRRVVVSFDGKTYGAFAEVDKAAQGSKGEFGWHQAGAGVTLAAGSHVLRVMKENTTSGAAILDAFYLTTGSEVPAEK